MNMTMIAAVAFGGAAGSVARYLTMSAVGSLGTDFPYATVVVNVLGSFVMGVLVEASALAWSPSPELRALLTVGVLGGFTTFSTFSMDAVLLIERNQQAQAALYAAASVVFSIGAMYLGMAAVRQVLR